MSRLNCRPGDLAIIIRPTRTGPQLLGMIVRVLHAAPAQDFRLPDGFMQLSGLPDYWVIELPRVIEVPMMGWIKSHRPSRYGIAPDNCLRPIRDNDGADETLTWRDVPTGVTA